MPNYFVTKFDKGDEIHEVHTSRCIFLPLAPALSISLGTFDCCADAIERAKIHYANATGCFVCSQDGHLRKASSQQKYGEQGR